MNSAGSNSKSMMNNASSFNDIDSINNTCKGIMMGWTMFSSDVWIVKEYPQFVWGVHDTSLTYPKVMEPTHMAEEC